MEINYTIHDNFDHIIEEKGNTFIALRKLTWGDKDKESAKLDLRKYYTSKTSNETVGKGVSITDDGADELIRVLLSNGYGDTEEILKSIKDRDNFEMTYDKVISGIEYIDNNKNTEVLYDPREVLFNEVEVA